MRIRPVAPGDFAFCTGLAPRLLQGAHGVGRSGEEMDMFTTLLLRDALEAPVPGSATLLAESPDGRPLGFLHAEPSHDAVADEACGYVTLLAVAPEAEGQGVAAALLHAAEAWARESGYRRLSLDAFTSNRHARAFYRRQGYAPEWVRLTRRLDDGAGAGQ